MENLKKTKLPSSFGQFLTEFCQNVQDDETFPFKIVPSLVTRAEIEGESMDWVLQYLSQNQCDALLALALARTVADESSKSNAMRDLLNADNTDAVDAHSLARLLHQALLDTCRRWMDKMPDVACLSPVYREAVTSRLHTVCSHAIRNTRRKMEDRHVVIQDLGALYNMSLWPHQSYYAVFDGHGGVDAAAYASAHLHNNLVRHPAFLSDPCTALKQAYKKTDEDFIEKAQSEGLKSGSTGVSCLVRGNELYMSWLGDSQALLVRNGTPVHMMEPHKPEREDEKRRIEDLGGCVVWFGAWRVNGSLSVSRAIGDADYKPYVSSDAEVACALLDGTEDYVILGCDGLWDVLTTHEVPHLVHEYVSENGTGSAAGVAQRLVQIAKDKGSNDNITVIVVFFREQIAKPESECSDSDGQVDDVLAADEDDAGDCYLAGISTSVAQPCSESTNSAINGSAGGLPSVTGSLPSVTGSLPSVTGSLPSVTGSLPIVTGSMNTFESKEIAGLDTM